MKRYLLFRYDPTSGLGGWHHYAGSFDTVEEAKAATPAGAKNHIVDTTTEKIVFETGAFPRAVGDTDRWVEIKPRKTD